jgi:hypothetical protein
MIPDSTLRLARDLMALQARALAEHVLLTEAANQASGAEAVGKAALASECEQVGKVLANYIPRIMKHVGEIDPPTEDVPSGRIAELEARLAEAEAALEEAHAPQAAPDLPAEVVDILTEHGLNFGDSYERVNEVLVKRYADAMGNSEYARGNPDGTHGGKSVIEWLAIAARADSGVKWNRGRAAETI